MMFLALSVASSLGYHDHIIQALVMGPSLSLEWGQTLIPVCIHVLCARTDMHIMGLCIVLLC